MNTTEPSKAIIDKVKEEHPDRSVLHVEIDHEGETYHFLMTGPNEPEYKKFIGEILEAKDKPKESEQSEGIRTACVRAALAMVRWPDRTATDSLFKRFPAMPHHFREQLHKAASVGAEVRSKKL
jgi:hypothetical protein